MGSHRKAQKHRAGRRDRDPTATVAAARPEATSTNGSSATAPRGTPRMSEKVYERELRVLHGELVALQEWVKSSGAKVCIVFEGRDTAGKGGTINAITQRVSPRTFRVVALPTPTEREQSQMYMQRYVAHFPAAGEVVIFDRSWYNRAGIERVMGICTDEQARRFLDLVPDFEKAMVDSGILLIKYWLEVGPEEQVRRLTNRIDDPRKVWKLSSMDLKSYRKWDEYTWAREEMFVATDTAWAPWWVARTDDKRRGRLNVITHLLAQVPYEPLAAQEIKLPKRTIKSSGIGAESPVRFIPARY
jgi:polyphosphate kinase